MKKILSALFILSFFLIADKAFASGTVRCETQYGGGQVCTTSGSVSIDKKVCDISTKNCDPDSNYFDNMTLSDHLFQIGEQIIFKIKVTNTGTQTIKNIKVTDTLPNYLMVNQNSINNKLSYEISELKPGASDTRRVDTIVKSDLPKGTNCVLNTANASASDGSDYDTAQVCLGKGEPVTTIPEAGPSDWLLAITSSLLLAGSGIYLIKKAY